MPSPELHYASRQPLHRRPSFHRRIYAVAAFAILATGWWWMPPTWRRCQLLYWQDKCLHYVASSGQVVADSQTGVKICPQAWVRFYSLLSPPGFKSDGTVFLHALKSPWGNYERLVAVDVSKVGNTFVLNGRVFKPGGALTSPIETTPIWDGGTWFLSGASVQITAGTVDPGNPNHFSFTCMINGIGKTYDGWLTRYDNVELRERLVPAGAGE